MSTATCTETETTTITAGDVRRVMALTTQEITAICRAAAGLTRDFDADSALVDCALLALNDVVTAIHLQIYLGDEIVREYSYVIATRRLEATGSSADCPPVGPLPDGARVRLTVSRNRSQPEDYTLGWLRRLGWSTGRPLRRPDGVAPETYGTFVSGGFGMERQLLVNPKYDRPIGCSEEQFRKEE